MPGFGAADLVLALLVAVAAATDLRERRIFNWLTVPCAAAGLLAGAWEAGLPGLVLSVSGSALAGACLLPFFAAGAVGGGDVKLLAAAGAAARWPFIGDVLLWTAGWALVFSLLTLLRARGGLDALVRASSYSFRLALSKAGWVPWPGEAPRSELWIPLAPALLAGTVCAWLSASAASGGG